MGKYGELILEIINGSDEHLTVEQIFQRAREHYPRMVLATVYNNVNRLVDQGKIRRIKLEGYPDRYDRIVRHDHLVCKNCGKLLDITLEDLTDRLAEETGVDVLSYDLKICYICPECRARMAEPGKQ